MKTIFLGIGSNIENRMSFIEKSLSLLSVNLNILKISTVYESKPWGVIEQSPFLNLVIKAETILDPLELLKFIKETEVKVGRKKRYRWGPREIDIDILLYSGEIINTESLKVPHPFICERDFFLYPLIEIEPTIKHPLFNIEFSSFTSKTKNHLKPFCCIICHL